MITVSAANSNAPPRALLERDTSDRWRELLDATDRMAKAIMERLPDVELDEQSFPTVAAEELRSAALHDLFDAPDVVSAVLRGEADPYVDSSDFSDLPLRLLSNSRFRIECLIWSENATTVHDHGFVGAFTLVHGHSLSAEYRFCAGAKSTELIKTGSLELGSLRVLRPGDVVAITRSPRFIHSNFHLSRPTATIVVRTHRSEGRQFDYYGSGSAGIAHCRVGTAHPRALALLTKGSPERAVAEAVAAVRQLPLAEAFDLFCSISPDAEGAGILAACAAALAARPDGLAIVAAAAARRRAEHLVGCRGRMVDAGQLLSLGAFLAIGAKDDVVAALRAYSIDVPPAALAECMATILLPAPTDIGAATELKQLLLRKLNGEDVDALSIESAQCLSSAALIRGTLDAMAPTRVSIS